jgi:alpha-tubulin suppressor-like RCC1 family protein
VALAGLSLVIGLLAPVTGSEAVVTTAAFGYPEAWGDNQYGQVGDGTQATRTRPVDVFGEPGLTQVAAGAVHTLAVRWDGIALAWG